MMADLLEVPAIALLVVSDNSAAGTNVFMRTDEEQEKYNYGRNEVLTELILKTVASK